jgi:hypothetical protein
LANQTKIAHTRETKTPWLKTPEPRHALANQTKIAHTRETKTPWLINPRAKACLGSTHLRSIPYLCLNSNAIGK